MSRHLLIRRPDKLRWTPEIACQPNSTFQPLLLYVARFAVQPPPLNPMVLVVLLQYFPPTRHQLCWQQASRQPSTTRIQQYSESHSEKPSRSVARVAGTQPGRSRHVRPSLQGASLQRDKGAALQRDLTVLICIKSVFAGSCSIDV